MRSMETVRVTSIQTSFPGRGDAAVLGVFSLSTSRESLVETSPEVSKIGPADMVVTVTLE